MPTFDLFDETFTYADEFPSFAYTEFCEAMDDGVEAEGAHAQAVAWRLALSCVADRDQQRFRITCRKNRASVDAWLKVFHGLLEELSARPTQQPTDSSGGLDSAPESSASQPVASVTPLTAPPPPLVPGSMALALVRSQSA